MHSTATSPRSGQSHTDALVVVRHAEPPGALEALTAGALRGLLRITFKTWVGPRLGAIGQRRVVSALARFMPGVGGVHIAQHEVAGVRTEVITPHQAPQAVQPPGQPMVMLYLHGGGFCVGSPRTHRSVTTRLAAAGLTVWVPDYRLAPEHPCPAALDDALACYRELLRRGVSPSRIVVCGDSAGGGLSLSLALALRDAGEPMPAGLMLLSPFLDPALSGETVHSAATRDPMLAVGWLQQAVRWYAPPADQHLLNASLAGLPPMLIQVGDQEVLQDDAMRLGALAARCGVPCQLEVYAGRWHVFQLQAGFLASAAQAIRRLASFAAHLPP